MVIALRGRLSWKYCQPVLEGTASYLAHLKSCLLGSASILASIHSIHQTHSKHYFTLPNILSDIAIHNHHPMAGPELPPLTEFHLFPRLPPELRQCVFDLTLLNWPPKTITVCLRGTPVEHNIPAGHNESDGKSPAACQASPGHETRSMNSCSLSIITALFKPRRPATKICYGLYTIPAPFAVNCEARARAMVLCPPRFEECFKNPIYFGLGGKDFQLLRILLCWYRDRTNGLVRYSLLQGHLYSNQVPEGSFFGAVTAAFEGSETYQDWI